MSDLRKIEGVELEDAIAGLDAGWTCLDGVLCKDFTFEAFGEAADFLAALGELSDDLEGHCPSEVTIRAGVLRLCLSTPAVQGVSDADIDFARLADYIMGSAMADAVADRYLDGVQP